MVNNGEKICVRGLRDVAAAETRISFVDPLGHFIMLDTTSMI